MITSGEQARSVKVDNSRHNARSIWSSTAILLIGAIAILIHAGTLTLWSDEIWSVFHSTGSLSQIFNDPDVTWPFGYYLTLHAWTRFASDNDFSIHVLGVLIGLLTTACLICVGRRLFSPLAGWLAGLTFATSSYAIYFLLEVRGYGLMLLTEALFLWIYLRWRDRPTLRRSVLLWLAQVAMLYTHFILVAPIVLAGAHTLVSALKRSERRHMIRWISLAMLTVLTFLPLLLQFLRGAGLRTAVGSGALPGYFLKPFYTFYEAYSAHWDLWFALILIAATLGLLINFRRVGWQTLGWLIIWAVAIPIGAYLTKERTASFTTRYLSFTMPALFLLIGVGLAGFVQRVNQWSPLTRPVLRRLPGLAVLGLIVGLAVAPWQPYDHRPADTDTPPLDQFMRAMAAKSQPGDIFVLDPHAGCCDPVAWDYYRSLYFPAATLTQAQANMPLGARVWYIERQGSIDQAAKTRLTQGRLARDFWGPWYFAATLYEAPPLVVGVRFGETVLFHGIQIDRRAEIEAGDTLPMTIWWSAGSVPAGDYSISIRLISPTGVLITQADGGPQTSGTPTQLTQWQPQRLYLDRRTLSVPYGLADGDYTLQLIVYQWWDGQRLSPALLEQDSHGLAITPDHALIVDRVHVRSYAVWPIP